MKSLRVLCLCGAIALIFFAKCSSEEEQPVLEDTNPPLAGDPIRFTNIRSTSVTISWGEASDDVTPKERLQYRVLTSSTYININTISECAKIGSSGVVREWGEYVPSITLTDLAPQTTYWFAVLVRDEKGNMAIYYPQQVRTLADDAPLPGLPITFNDAVRTETSVYVMWGAATDSNYSTEVLEYRLVKSDSATKIDTIQEALAVPDSDVVMEWTQNVLEKQVTGLSMGTRYYFAVLVRNPKLKIALYSPKMTATKDIQSPTVGGNIYFSGVDVDRMTVNWPPATDNLTLQGDLYYKLVQANTAEEIDTVEEANQTQNVVLNWTRNKLSVTVKNLSEYTKYYFSVLVKDEQNNMALYAPQGQYTKDIRTPIVPVIEKINDVSYYLAYGNITGNSVTIYWKQADDPDPGTPTEELQYRLVWAENPSEIDEAHEVNWYSNVVKSINSKVKSTNGVDYDWVPGAVLTWDQNNQHAVTVENLDDAKTYYFAIAVRDFYGNASVYSPRMVKTKDITPPQVGNITVAPQDVHSSWIKLTFTEAEDNNYSKDQLEYRVVIAQEISDINTISKVLNMQNDFPPTPGIVHNWDSFNSSYSSGIIIGNLTNNTTYYIAVAVKDPENNAALYYPIQVTTHSSWEYVGTENFAITASFDSFALSIVNGIPHVIYLDGVTQRYEYVTVMQYMNDQWFALGEAGFSNEPALDVDIEADGNGNTYAGYIAYNNNSPVAKVKKYMTNSWSDVSTIPSPLGIIQQLDLAMKANNPAIFVIDKYSYNENIKWKPRLFEYTTVWEEINSFGSEGVGDNAYVFGSLGYAGNIPYVSFNDVDYESKLSVKAHMGDPTQWTYVGTSGFSNTAVLFSQIAFDSAQVPHVAYLELEESGMRVRVKKYNGSTWIDVGEQPINTGGYAAGLSLAMFGTTPYVAFSDSTKNYKVRVMRLKNDGSGWEYVEAADTGISPSSVNNIAIAIDSFGNPYIAFRQSNKLNVMVYK